MIIQLHLMMVNQRQSKWSIAHHTRAKFTCTTKKCSEKNENCTTKWKGNTWMKAVNMGSTKVWVVVNNRLAVTMDGFAIRSKKCSIIRCSHWVKYRKMSSLAGMRLSMKSSIYSKSSHCLSKHTTRYSSQLSKGDLQTNNKWINWEKPITTLKNIRTNLKNSKTRW